MKRPRRRATATTGTDAAEAPAQKTSIPTTTVGTNTTQLSELETERSNK